MNKHEPLQCVTTASAYAPTYESNVTDCNQNLLLGGDTQDGATFRSPCRYTAENWCAISDTMQYPFPG